VDVAHSKPRALKRQLKLFLCHASVDKPHVLALYDLLISDGVKPWLDEREILPGQDWELEIQKSIKTSDLVLVCLSTRSVTKEGFVQKEIALAVDAAQEKPEGTIFIVPTRLDPCMVPDRLRKWHWVDFFDQGGYEKLIASCMHRAQQLGLRLQKKSKNVPGSTGALFNLRKFEPSDFSSYPYTKPMYSLATGEHIRIVSGPLAGLTGVVKNRISNRRIVISVLLLTHKVAVEIDAGSVVPIVERGNG
jgi:hypothetical protein